MKLHQIIQLIALHLTFSYADDNGLIYEPYMSLKNYKDPIVRKIDFYDRMSHEYESVVQKFLCPAESDEDAAKLEGASKHNYRLKYCLFEKVFKQNDEVICRKEVKPVLIELIDTENKMAINCGFSSHQSLHAFSFPNCGGLAALNKFREADIRNDVWFYKYPFKSWYTYEICYDMVEKRAIWTMHHIQMPQLFQNPHLRKKQQYETKIDTNSYFMDNNLFLAMKRKYDSQKELDTSSFIMVPRSLVPSEHYPLPMLKKTTNHYINTAPLWEKLVPLMSAIDEGLKRAQITLESQNPTSYKNLIIVTRVLLATPAANISNQQYNSLLFEGNIWYKFVYREENQSGVLIIIHNTPRKPPAPSKGCFAAIPKNCDFEIWSDNEKIRAGITSEEKKYAYCCKVESKHVQEIFYIDSTPIKEYFKIEELVTKGEDHVSKL